MPGSAEISERHTFWNSSSHHQVTANKIIYTRSDRLAFLFQLFMDWFRPGSHIAISARKQDSLVILAWEWKSQRCEPRANLFSDHTQLWIEPMNLWLSVTQNKQSHTNIERNIFITVLGTKRNHNFQKVCQNNMSMENSRLTQ